MPKKREQEPQFDTSQTNTIREVFGYINRFKNEVFVLRIDDALIDSPLFPLLLKDIVLIRNMGIRTILVPGAKHSIDEVLKSGGLSTASHNGIRITPDEALPLVKLGASNVTNRILTLLSENNVQGVSGNWVRAREIGVIGGVDFMNTGRVEAVKIPVIEKLLENNLIPILANIGWSAVGKPYNISSMELAVETAKAIHASKLFFVGTCSGIPEIPGTTVDGLNTRENGVYSSVEIGRASLLLEKHQKELSGEFSDFITSAIDACAAGVNRVHIVDGREDGILLREIFSSSGCGTMFHGNVHANIRGAQAEDISDILHIMQPYVSRGVLVQRTAESIGEELDSYYVYQLDDAVHGCGAISYFRNHMAEIKAVVVDPQYAGRGTGKKMVSFLLEKARKNKVKTVFVLTTQSSDFFMNMGFSPAPIDSLPEERKANYSRDRKSKVLTFRL